MIIDGMLRFSKKPEVESVSVISLQRHKDHLSRRGSSWPYTNTHIRNNNCMLIKNGTVISAQGTHRLDIRVRDEIIVAIAPDLAPEQDESVVDASGLSVLP